MQNREYLYIDKTESLEEGIGRFPSIYIEGNDTKIKNRGGIIMIDRLEAIVTRFNEINEELSSPDIVSDIKRMTELSKEQTRLSETVEVYKRYKEVTTNIEEDKELVRDPELGEFAKEIIQKSVLASWLKPILYTLQIYFDFQ